MVVISLTTIKKRIKTTLPRTLWSILNQTHKAEKIYLHSPENIKYPGITCIKYDKDIGSALKLLPTLKYDVDEIITIDDDIVYPEDFIENTLALSKKYSGAIGYSGYNVNSLLKENQINFDLRETKDVITCDILEGFLGVYYRKSFFDDTIHNMPSLFRTIDDIWISGNLEKNGVKRYLAPYSKNYHLFDPDGGLHSHCNFYDINRQGVVYFKKQFSVF